MFFLACEHGYFGINCETRCPFPYYGFKCRLVCNCMDTDCDHISGCGTASGGTSTITLCFGLKRSIKNGVKNHVICSAMVCNGILGRLRNNDML